MEKGFANHSIFCALWIAFHLALNADTATAAEHDSLLTGKAAMGDWTADAPGVRRKITVQDLPAPSSNILSINSPESLGVRRTPNFGSRPVLRSTFMQADFAIRAFSLPPQTEMSSSPRVAAIKSKCCATQKAAVSRTSLKYLRHAI